MKVKTNQIIIIAVVAVILSVAYMYMTRNGSKPGKGKTIVTEMPQSGYSIDNDGYDNSGLPEALPETLPPPPEVDVPEPEMMGMDTPTMAPSWGATTPGPVVDQPEEFTQYAPRRFRGDIL
jgi:hypothetical protein